jgi:hypothetical protein
MSYRGYSKNYLIENDEIIEFKRKEIDKLIKCSTCLSIDL